MVAKLYYQRYGKQIDLKSNGFNAGIWGINLRRWVDLNYTKEAEWWLKANDEYRLWSLGTQPVMLIVLYNDWVSLPDEWNVEGLGWRNRSEKKLKSAKLLHWNGENKPWSSDQTSSPPRQMLWRHYTCPSQRGGISMDDPVPGWAGMNQSKTVVTRNRKDNNDACTVRVRTAHELRSHLKGPVSSFSSVSPCPEIVLLLEPGVYFGSFEVQRSYVTIVGTNPGVLIYGNLYISHVSYVTVRNLAVKGLPCIDYEDCKWGPDAIGVRDHAHHIWLDHLDVSDGQDGNLDITRGADYVTVSWCIFRYVVHFPVHERTKAPPVLQPDRIERLCFQYPLPIHSDAA